MTAGTSLKLFENQRIIVTGAAGTVGRELVRQLLELSVTEVRALDGDENGLFHLGEEHSSDSRCQAFYCDVRSEEHVRRLFRDCDLIFHLAALKHVPLSERSPFETVQTNVHGVENVIRGAIHGNAKRVLLTSSDKAVNPTNVMGTSKLMGERLITAANALIEKETDTLFTSTRFGNVAGSAGSVIPLFCQQIARGGPVTLTDPEMTRFVMTLADAVKLVITSMALARGGEVFVTKMPVVRIVDLADVLIELVAPAYGRDPRSIEITRIGSRSGEKLFEELLNEEELRRTVELDTLFAVLPAFRNIYGRISYEYPNMREEPVNKVYNSATEHPLDKKAIRAFLLQPDVLPSEITSLLSVKKSSAA